MVRSVLRFDAVWGHFADAVAASDACNAVCRERGWAEWNAWTPFTGKGNEIVLTADYPDLATCASERDAAFTDADFMEAWRRCAEFVVPGSIRTEVLEPAPQLA
jgi:hypothetical protein